MARPRSPFTEFVLTLPLDLPTKEVLAKAKARGITGTSKALWKTREKIRSGKLAASKATASRGAPAKSAPAKSAPAKSPAPAARVAVPASKSDFIRDQPVSMPARQVVARAKAAGLTFNDAYVYRVRAMTKGRGPAPKTSPVHVTRDPKTPDTSAAAGRSTTPRMAPPVARPISTTSKAEELLKAVAAEIGLASALEILSAERARVRRLITG